MSILPEEIVNILKKHQEQNVDILQNINQNISEMISSLEEVNKYIADQTRNLLVDKNTNNNADELLSDSVAIRNFINTINLLDINTECSISSFDEEISEEFVPQVKFIKKVYPFLISDDLCPFCNVKLLYHSIYYCRITNNQLNDEVVGWHRCPNCRRLFALDYEIEDFDFENTNIILNKDKYDVIPQMDICSVIILSNTLNCSAEHKTKDIIAKLPVLHENGDLTYLAVNASYCFDCDRFTILKEEYIKIKDIIMCKVIDKTYDVQNNSSNAIELEQKNSTLFKYGYNVQTKKNISTIQRNIILASIIEANIMNRRDIINHIEILIERGEKIPSWKDAVTKWKEDKLFVSEYKKEELPAIIFDKIILKYRTNQS